MDLHLTRLHEAVNWSRAPATETLARLTQHFQGSDARLMALKEMMGMVRQQAAVMSFADVFLILTVLFVALAAFGIIMRRPQPAGGGRGRTLIGGNMKGTSHAGTGSVRNKHRLQFHRLGDRHGATLSGRNCATARTLTRCGRCSPAQLSALSACRS